MNRCEKRKFERHYHWKFSWIDEKHKSSNLGDMMTPKQDKQKKTTYGKITVKIQNTKDTKKIVKQPERRDTFSAKKWQLDWLCPVKYCSVIQSCPTFCDPHAQQHTRPPCPSTFHKVCPSSCPLHSWFHPAISSSDTLFSFGPQSFPASGTFPTNQLVTSDEQNTGASASVLPMGIQGWFSLRLIGLISLLSKKLSGVFPSTTVQRYQFFGTPPSLRPALSTIHDHWEDRSLDYMYFYWQNDISAFQHTIQVCHTFPARSNHLLISGCRHHPQGF